MVENVAYNNRMRELQRKRKQKKYWQYIYSVPVIFLLVIVLTLSLKQTWSMYQTTKGTEEKLNDVEAAYQEASAREAELEEDIARLKTDTGVEEEIRNTYGFIKEGEEVVIMVDPEEVPEPQEIEIKETVWDKLKGIF